MKFLSMIENLKSKKEQMLRSQDIIFQLLETDGMKLILEDLKQTLTEEYGDLMAITDINTLVKKQERVKIIFNLINRIHGMAGVDWYWDGYKLPKNVVSDDLTEEQKAYQKFLETQGA